MVEIGREVVQVDTADILNQYSLFASISTTAELFNPVSLPKTL